MPGLDSLLDLGVVDLEQQAELSSNRIAHLGDLLMYPSGQPASLIAAKAKRNEKRTW